MQIALLLAREIAQLFLILLAGFVLVRAGLLRAADSKVLSVILVYLVIPCVIVDAFQIEDTPAIRAGLALSFGAAAAIHLLFLLLTWLLRRPLGLDAIERATAIYSNAGSSPWCRRCSGRSTSSTPAPSSSCSWCCCGPTAPPSCGGPAP